MKTPRKKFRFPFGSKARIGCIMELQESIALPRPEVKTFIRHDGVRIQLCESATVRGIADDYNRRIWPTWKVNSKRK